MRTLLCLSMFAMLTSVFGAKPARADFITDMIVKTQDQIRRAQEEAARQAAAALAEEMKSAQEKIRSADVETKKAQRDGLTRSLRDYAYFTDSLDRLEQDVDHLAEAAQVKGNGGRINGSILPWLKKLVGQNVDYGDEVLSAMQELAKEAAEPVASAGDAAADLQRNRDSLLRAEAAIRRLRDCARVHDVEMNLMVANAITASPRDEAESMRATLIGMRAKVASLHAYIQARITQTELSLTELTIALNLIGG